MNNNKNHFGFLSIFPHLLIIAAAVGGYYLILKNNLFYDWQIYIYYGLKALIAIEIVLASARSFIAPIIGIAAAALFIYFPDLTGITLISITPSDGWQLLVVSMIGLLITALIKLK